MIFNEGSEKALETAKYVFGPVPSRRLGLSVGVSPIPKKACNYSCIYCQLGRTDRMSSSRREFFKLSDIVSEFKSAIRKIDRYDIVTVVGEGEPSLYLRLGELIRELKALSSKPVAVITNGALLSDAALRKELSEADIVLPSLDATDEAMFRRINRPHGSLSFDKFIGGLQSFSSEYSGKGELYLELMLIEGINDDEQSLLAFRELLKGIKYDRLYLNTPVRPPAEEGVKALSHEKMQRAAEFLGGSSIDLLLSSGFYSGISDDMQAVLSIIGRHPMNGFEIAAFLESRGNKKPEEFLERLRARSGVEEKEYRGRFSYRYLKEDSESENKAQDVTKKAQVKESKSGDSDPGLKAVKEGKA